VSVLHRHAKVSDLIPPLLAGSGVATILSPWLTRLFTELPPCGNITVVTPKTIMRPPDLKGRCRVRSHLWSNQSTVWSHHRSVMMVATATSLIKELPLSWDHLTASGSYVSLLRGCSLGNLSCTQNKWQTGTKGRSSPCPEPTTAYQAHLPN
jgi:hypothetical protein